MNIRKVQQWFKENISEADCPYTLDKHQAAIVLDSHKHTLVTARAGSGKTRTIVAKIVYLIAHEHIPPDRIIVFAFNRKARAEINERLLKIKYQNHPLISGPCRIATTFHAYAYKILGINQSTNYKLLTEVEANKIIKNCIQHILPEASNLNQRLLAKLLATAKQFILRAEQIYFKDYQVLSQKIQSLPSSENKASIIKLEHILTEYQDKLRNLGLLNFNQLIAKAAKSNMKKDQFSYIFVDEYQDFSLLFLNLIKSILKFNPSAHLLTVGDDWQAINRFAGSDVEYFKNFQNYFREDYQKLFIPTNYRSGKKIVKNANFFMSTALNDYQGCKSGGKTRHSRIYVQNVKNYQSNPTVEKLFAKYASLPLLLQNYLKLTSTIILQNPGKTIKILHRNNDLSFRDWTLEKFCQKVTESLLENNLLTKKSQNLISFSTIHRSKGLESDIVVLLEIDANKFPGQDKSNGFGGIFGDTKETLLEDEARLFYVALTRPKEKLYILSKTTTFTKDTAKQNFLSFLNPDWLDYL